MRKATQQRRFENALRVLDEHGSDKELDMAVWGRRNRGKHSCETACCLAGWMGLDLYFKRAGFSAWWGSDSRLHCASWVDEVRWVLGIKSGEAVGLVNPTARNGGQARKAEVRRRLLGLMKVYKLKLPEER